MPRRNGVLYGEEKPRIYTPPLRRLTRKTTLGFEAIEFAENILGWTLYPWQKWFLKAALELLPDGRPRYKTILLMIARQNGKTTIIQILTLWKMYVQGARLTLGTAQKLDDAEEVWKEALELVEENPLLDAELKQVVRKNGSTEFNLVSGERYKVAAANRKGGRGRSVDGFVVIDELREQQSWDAWSALTKTTMAKATGQVIAMSNAGDAGSVVLRTLRDRNLAAIEAGTAKSVGHFEYSAPENCQIDDRKGWAQANPSLGYGDMTEEVIEAAMESDPEDVFRVEVLCQWWQRRNSSIFPEGTWEGKEDPASEIAVDSPLILSLAAWQSGSSIGHASLAAAGLRPDGDTHVELLVTRDGLDWALDRTVEMYKINEADGLVIQGRGSVASRWIDDLRDEGVNVIELAGAEIGKAHGSFYQGIIAGPDARERIWHIGQDALTFAANEADISPLGGVWVFKNEHPVADIDPLVAGVQAAWGLKWWQTRAQARTSSYEDADLLVV